MSRLIILSMALAISCSLAGCAAGPTPLATDGAELASAEMPEYSTGSSIAKKKGKAAPGEVKNLPPEQLDEMQRNSSISR